MELRSDMAIFSGAEAHTQPHQHDAIGRAPGCPPGKMPRAIFPWGCGSPQRRFRQSSCSGAAVDSLARKLRPHAREHLTRAHIVVRQPRQRARHAEGTRLLLGIWARGAERRDRGGQQVEDEERRDRADVEATNRWDDAAEEVQVDVRHGEDRAEEGDALRLREPAEQDPQREDAAVDAQEAATRRRAQSMERC